MTVSERRPGPYLVVGLGNPGPKYAATGTTSARWSGPHRRRRRRRFAAAKRAQAAVLEGRLGAPGSGERASCEDHHLHERLAVR